MAALPVPSSAGWRETFTDPEDGRLDFSTYLLEHKGALPVPIAITEPAIGYGGGVALLFFQQSLADRITQRAGPTRYRPPDIYAAAGFGTENGTWGTGAGGLLSFADDRWRWRGGAGYVSANLDFYGVASTLLYRVGESHAWIAADVRYISLESRFDAGSSASFLDAKRVSAGIGPTAEYDSRDNLFTANRGWTGALETMFYDPAWGSDAEFQTYRAHLFAYAPVPGRIVLGTRLDARNASSDTPFYMLPYIDLRGIPAVRYQGRNTTVVEAEARWNLDRRWALMGFYGLGRAWGSADDFDAADTHDAGGTGFRYLLARRLGVYSGIDFAWGPEFALYLQVGSAWR